MDEIFGFPFNLLERIRIIDIYVLHIVHLCILYLKLNNTPSRFDSLDSLDIPYYLCKSIKEKFSKLKRYML